MNVRNFLLPWHELPIVVIDFETDGVDPAACMPIEVAAVRFEGGAIVAIGSSFVNPGRPIPAEATAIHGITDEMVADAPDMHGAVLAMDFARLIHGAIPCGYNGNAFDRVILQRFIATPEYLATDTKWPWLDPLVVVRHVDRYVPGKGRHKLTTTCERHGITMSTGHRALADAEATGRLLLASKAIRHTLGDATISEVLRRQALQAARQEAAFKDWQAKNPKPEGAT